MFLPSLLGLFAIMFASAYVGWGLYGLTGKRRYVVFATF